MLKRKWAAKLFGGTTLGTVIFLTTAGPAIAQTIASQSAVTADVTVADQAQSAAASGDIVVTARKTAERLQDVPISLSAVGGDDLRNRSAVDVKDVLRTVPGVSFTGTERGLSSYNIRGVSTSAYAPTVGIYLDDISLVTISTFFSGGFDPVFFDMERLEILKGPQGTLYGGSAMGGAIKYVSAKPDLTRIGGDVVLGGAGVAHGSASYNGEAVLNLPVVTDHLAVRGGFYFRHEAGYVDNLPGGLVDDARTSSTPQPVFTPATFPSLSTRSKNNQNDADTFAARFSVLWRPDPSWNITAGVFHQDYKLQNPGQIFTNDARPLTSRWRIAQPTQDRGNIYSLDIRKTVGAVQFTSLTAYFDRSLNFTRDYTYFIGGLVPAVLPLTTTNLSASRTRTFSEELRVQSDTSAAAPFKWIAGLYFSDQKDRLSQIITTPGAELIYGGTAVGYDGATATHTRQYAAFGEIGYQIVDGLTATAGVRVFKVMQSLDALYQGILNGPTTSVSGRNSDDSGVNPKFGLSYKIAANNLVYASATKGFRPGGANRFAINSSLCRLDLDRLGLQDAPTTYGSDSLWTYELGSKNQFDHGRLTLNASVFYTNWSKIQQLVYLNSCGFSYAANAGTATLKGVELEGRYNLTRSLQVGANGSFTDAKLDRAGAGSAAQDGDELQGVPRWMASAYASYTTELAPGWEIQVRGDYQYQSRSRLQYERFTLVNYPGGLVGQGPNYGEFRSAYDVANAYVSLTHGKTNFRLYVNNITNNSPRIDYDALLGTIRSTTLRPRTIGAELKQSF